MPKDKDKIKKMIRRASPKLTKEEMEEVERELRVLAEIVLDAYIEKRRKRKNKPLDSIQKPRK